VKAVFVFTFAANLVLCAVAWVVCPGTVANHFGPGGEPNGWMLSGINALVMGGTSLLLFVSFYFTPHLLRVVPARWVNVPHRDYWMAEENRPRMIAIMSRSMYAFGTAIFGFLFVVQALVLDANLSDPVRFREEIFWWPFGAFMLYSVVWTIRLFLSFRVPGPAGRREGNGS